MQQTMAAFAAIKAEHSANSHLPNRAPDLDYMKKYYNEIGKMLYDMIDLQSESEMKYWAEETPEFDDITWAQRHGFKEVKSYYMHLALGTLHERIADSAFAAGNRTWRNDVIEPYVRRSVESFDKLSERRRRRAGKQN